MESLMKQYRKQSGNNTGSSQETIQEAGGIIHVEKYS